MERKYDGNHKDRIHAVATLKRIANGETSKHLILLRNISNSYNSELHIVKWKIALELKVYCGIISRASGET